MKAKILFLLIAITSLMVGCKANYPVAQQSGKADMAYLVFVGPSKTYGNGSKTVQVDVDGNKFDAKVVKPKTANRKGTQYGIATGRRNITVKFNDQTIYQKQLFLSSQETKIINLP
ncbi:hypothetical protein [Segatella albensis]|jgi:hypothetical protein|uniref:hypothetical protein n=1 Tax=Segatella albensis TaxID=77768 RepID=UPI000469E8C9|nr:hypothetical protein [Segatella albensis]